MTSGETVHSVINGRELDTGQWLTRENPAFPERVVGQVSLASAALVDEAVTAADAAFTHWATTPLEERKHRVLDAIAAVEQQLDPLADLLTLKLGKVREGSLGELRFSLAYARYCASIVEDLVRSRVDVDDLGALEIQHEPFGVVAAVTPWNAPIILSFLKVAPALLTGNTVVLKPSPLSPLTITRVLGIMAAALPPGVLSVVNGDVAAGEALTTHPLVRKVAFTGGSVVAKKILAGTAPNLVPTVMELGGNDAAIFLEDADLSDTAMERAILGSFLSSGQVCMAAKRLYVHSSRFDEFVDRYVKVAEGLLVMGDPMDPHVTYGPLVNRAQMAHVESMTAEALAGGAVAHELGTVADPDVVAGGYFLRPLLLTGTSDQDRVVAEEQFGPVVPVLSFEDEDEVIARANDDPLGLGSSVWSADVDRAFRVGRRLRAGFTFINSHNRSGMSMRAPFGGMKGSGFGREYGPDGIMSYVQSHALHAPHLDGVAVHGYPGASRA